MLPESRFYRAVREFALTAPVWDPTRLVVETTPEDRWDLTLVSERVYGNRYEYLAVMAAAGLDRLDQELTERELVLPSPERLELIKQACNYQSKPVVPLR